MKNAIEIISSVLDVVIMFIYFNGVLGRKEGIGGLFWGFFCAAAAVSIIRTNMYLPFQVNICVSIALLLLVAFL